jgi:hypothetical protein
MATFESLPTGKKLSALRLSPRFRFALYAAFSTLFATGMVWLVADSLRDAPTGEIWQETAAYMLMFHGGAAMVTLMLLGALVPLHIQRAWRSRRNRLTGPVMITVNAVLIATAFGLYYFGLETLRSWMSGVHTVVGIALPALLVVHVVLGRRSR